MGPIHRYIACFTACIVVDLAVALPPCTQYVGCYYDKPKPLLSYYEIIKNSKSLTVDECFQRCAELGYANVALTGHQPPVDPNWEGFCGCGFGIPSDAIYNETGCDVPCPGDITQMCGGFNGGSIGWSSVYVMSLLYCASPSPYPSRTANPSASAALTRAATPSRSPDAAPVAAAPPSQAGAYTGFTVLGACLACAPLLVMAARRRGYFSRVPAAVQSLADSWRQPRYMNMAAFSSSSASSSASAGGADAASPFQSAGSGPTGGPATAGGAGSVNKGGAGLASYGSL